MTPNPADLDSQAAAVLAAIAASGLPPLEALTVSIARAAYRRFTAEFGGPLPEMAEIRAAAAAVQAGPIPLRLYRPPGLGAAAAPALIYLHGGGWVIGDFGTHERICRQIAVRAGCAVVAVDYRLAPEHRAPAAADDAIAALRWIAAHAAALNIDAGRLGVAGDSAGGNLAAAACLALRETGPALRCQVLIYPALDLRDDPTPYASKTLCKDAPPLTSQVSAWYLAHYRPDARLAADVRLSPICAADVSRLPPALLITAGFDILHDEGVAYAERLEQAGVEVQRRHFPRQPHGFIEWIAAVDAAGEALDAIASWLKQCLRR